MPQAPLDLNDLNGKSRWEWSTQETPAEETARLAREEREHIFQIRMRWALFVAAALALLSAGVVGAIMVFQDKSPEMSRLGVGILSAALSGSLGFLSGRASIPKNIS